jgi:signal transduction histidine kinase/CheY-like chemotaxis protein
LTTNTTRVARLSSLGLGTVLLLLAAFAVAAALVTSRTVSRATRTTALTAAYERAHFAVGEEESLERKYRLEPGPEIRVKYRAAVAEARSAMREVARIGDEDDAFVARRVLREHGPYLAAIGRMFDAVDRRDLSAVARIDTTEVDPTFGKIERLVREGTARHREDSTAALHGSTAVTQRLVWVAPAVFGAGLLLLLLLWGVQRREQRAYDAEVAARLRRVLDEREVAESELAETRERLRHAQRLESVGQLAAGVAHDFNNLLQVILGYCGLLETKLPEESRGQLRDIATAAGRGADLTRQLLAFGRRQALKPAVWDANGIVVEVEGMLGRLLSSEIDFKTLPSETELRVDVDRGQLEQVLVNLVLNARDAMPNGGALTIFAEALELDRPVAVEDGELPSGSYVRIVVRDTGSGMNEETKARAFEPFFTTNEPGRGTGLGLATVYGIVRQSGGFLSLESTPGVGTEVAVCLPRTLGGTIVPLVPEAAGPVQSEGVDRILLVEDEAGVRAVVASYLREQGYEVLEAADGREGLELYAEHRGRVGVVVTDISMPRLDGWGLVNELRRVGERIPIVVMSGYPGRTHRADDDRLEQLAKPFALPELTHAIARLAHDAPDARGRAA